MPSQVSGSGRRSVVGGRRGPPDGCRQAERELGPHRVACGLGGLVVPGHVVLGDHHDACAAEAFLVDPPQPLAAAALGRRVVTLGAPLVARRTERRLRSRSPAETPRALPQRGNAYAWSGHLSSAGATSAAPSTRPAWHRPRQLSCGLRQFLVLGCRSLPGHGLGDQQIRDRALQRGADQVEILQPHRHRCARPERGDLRQRRSEPHFLEHGHQLAGPPDASVGRRPPQVPLHDRPPHPRATAVLPEPTNAGSPSPDRSEQTKCTEPWSSSSHGQATSAPPTVTSLPRSGVWHRRAEANAERSARPDRTGEPLRPAPAPSAASRSSPTGPLDSGRPQDPGPGVPMARPATQGAPGWTGRAGPGRPHR